MNSDAPQRLAEARMILELLGFDAEHSNERSALVLLALLRLTPADPWSEAAAPILGTRAIMDWIRDQYGVDYAPNTRETIRRFTLHQFADAMLVEQNPDDPKRPINSPKWCYQIRPRAVELIRSYGSEAFSPLLDAYLAAVPGLRDAAHSLKSSSANLGAMSLSAAAKRVELGARERLLERPAVAVALVANEFNRARAALKAASATQA